MATAPADTEQFTWHTLREAMFSSLQPHELSFEFLPISHVFVGFPALLLWEGCPFDVYLLEFIDFSCSFVFFFHPIGAKQPQCS